jgi:hypothetical protein
VAAGLAVAVLGALAALVLGVVDLRRDRAHDRSAPQPGHDAGHAWHH